MLRAGRTDGGGGKPKAPTPPSSLVSTPLRVCCCSAPLHSTSSPSLAQTHNTASNDSIPSSLPDLFLRPPVPPIPSQPISNRTKTPPTPRTWSEAAPLRARRSQASAPRRSPHSSIPSLACSDSGSAGRSYTEAGGAVRACLIGCCELAGGGAAAAAGPGMGSRRRGISSTRRWAAA